MSRLLELSFEVLTTPERLRLLARLEDELRRLPAVAHPLGNHQRRPSMTYGEPDAVKAARPVRGCGGGK